MKPIDAKCIEDIARVLAESMTGSEITSMFTQLDLQDFDEQRRQSTSLPFSNSTKWRRINESVLEACSRTKTAKPLFEVIEYVMRPESFLHDSNSWHKNIKSLNETLIFYGFSVADSGKVQHVQAATTFSEAQQRLETLDEKLSKLNIHPDVIKYCRSELLQENYFHAILEASKGILERVRQISNLSEDGNSLINECFSAKRPIVLIQNNLLNTQTEKSKYQGLKSLLNTIVYLYRNPNAHAPKLYDVTSETDAVTAFTLMSLANTLLDDCINVRDLD